MRFLIGDMFPYLSSDDMADQNLANFKNIRDLLLRKFACFVKSAYLFYFFYIQLCIYIVFSELACDVAIWSLAPLFVGIFLVVARSPQKQMGQSYAFSIITPVQYPKTIRDRAIMFNPCHAVGPNIFAIKSKHAVPRIIQSMLCFPAFTSTHNNSIPSGMFKRKVF